MRGLRDGPHGEGMLVTAVKGRPMEGAQRYKRREIETCACGVTLYMEECTRGPRTGQMIPRTEKGIEHRCKVGK